MYMTVEVPPDAQKHHLDKAVENRRWRRNDREAEE